LNPSIDFAGKKSTTGWQRCQCMQLFTACPEKGVSLEDIKAA